MLLLNRYCLILITCLTVSLQFLSLAKAGGGSDGGGQGVVFKDGSVRFLDLIKIEDLPTEIMSSQDIQDVFFEPHRYVKQLAFKNNNFFLCPIEKLKKHRSNIKSINRLIEVLTHLTVLNINFRLNSINNDSQLNELNLKLPLIASYSERIDTKLQEALASYVDGRLWIVNALYTKLSSTEKCALGIHESLRHLNFANIIKIPLNSTEIEIATRWFMDSTDFGDDIESVIKKLNDVTLLAEDYSKISQDKLKKSKALSNKLFSEWKNLSQEERNSLESQSWKLFNESSEANTNSVSATLNNPGIKKYINGIGFVEENFINSRMEEKLGYLQYWDTLNFQIVIRLF